MKVLECPKCAREVPEGQDFCGKCGESMTGGTKLEDFDLIRRFKVGNMVSGGFNIIAKFVDDILRSINGQLIAPYIKYKARALAMIVSVVILTVVISAILAYLDVITGEAFVFLVGIVLGFILTGLGKMLG
jgi:hypothetical protein